MLPAELGAAVLLTPELRSLIFEKLVLHIRCLRDAQQVLRFLAFCRAWREAAATVQAAIEQQQALSVAAARGVAGRCCSM